MPRARDATWCLSARRSARAIPCWSASAGSDFSYRHSGMVRRTRPGISRFRVGAIARPGTTTKSSLLQMLGKKRQAARPGDVGAGLVVARTLVTVKAVLGAGIDENLDLGPLGLDGLDIGQGNAGILFAEMQLRRHLRLVVGKAHDGAAVIADRRRQAGELGRGHIGDAAAEAKADDP